MMKKLIRDNLITPHFALVVIVATFCLFYFFYKQVSLEPQVSATFFFSKKSQIYKNDALVYKKFLVGDSIVLSMPTKNIREPDYLRLVDELTNKIKKIPGVISVQSITQGPPSLDAAIENPMWKRLLDSGSGQNSLILCFVEVQKITSIVNSIEKILSRTQLKGRRVYLSGIPYIIDEIRKMLSLDMKQFMQGAVAVSAIVVLIIFMSLFVTIGAIFSALTAAALTLFVQHHLGIPVGILTANLGAIVYVLTISHIVFLTSNWRMSNDETRGERLAGAIVTTLPASFWAMLTTLFGFVSLIFVEAKPLQQLGIGGSIGSVAAFLTSFIVFPIFLRFSKLGRSSKVVKSKKFFLPFRLHLGVPIALLLLAGATSVGWLGVGRLNTDPSLLTYFKSTGKIYRGIQVLDVAGGSNPLNFVISNRNGSKLKNEASYERMLQLQNDLENHPAVGSVLSLPVLMSETQKNWLARLIPWGSLLNILSRDKFDKVARGFISKDFSQGLFVIRMKESSYLSNRDRIVRQLMAKPRKYGFRLDLVGGSYYLQSELAKRVKSSMKTGVTALLCLFVVIIFLLSLSFSATLFASLSIAAATATFLGCLGLYKVPIDIISSPSVNVILGLAVDGMIHIILAARRMSQGKGRHIDYEGWIQAVQSQGRAVFVSALVIGTGYSVFVLSNFPPSQRFGLEIVLGTFLAMLMTLLVFPHLSMVFSRKKGQTP